MSSAESGRRRAAAELAGVVAIVALQALLDGRLLHAATNFDEGVYLAAADALHHGQRLGSDVFAAQFPGFYDLLRVLSLPDPWSVAGIRAAFVGVFCLGAVGAWLVGRRYGGGLGGAVTAGLWVVAPPLDLFGSQVIADTPALALMVLAIGLATIGGTVAAVAVGIVFALSLSIKLSALAALPALVAFLGRRSLPATAAALVTGAVILLIHAGALGSLWAGGVRYHQDARSTPAVIPHPHRQILDQIPHRTPFFVLAVLAIVVALVQLVRRRGLSTWPLWASTAAGVLFLLLHAPLHYNHLVVFPGLLALAVGATLASVLPATRAVAAVAAIVLAAAYVQQWHRVGEATAGEPATNVAAAHALAELAPPSARTIDDRPIISFLAHRHVVGPLVDLAKLRFETGSLTDEKVIARLDDAQAVVVSRELRDHPRILDAVRSRFHLRYDRGGVRIFVR
jgi:hypothetical protein